MAKCIDCDVTLPVQTRGAPRKRCDECRLKRKRELQRGYRESPKVKAREQAYRDRPEVKAHKHEYNRRPEVRENKREYQREYRKRPEGRVRDRQYDQRPEVKARRRLRIRLDRALDRALRGHPAPDDMRFRLAVKLIRGIDDDSADVLARVAAELEK